MKYLAVLGRQSEISLAELEALFSDIHKISNNLATFISDQEVGISRLGGSLKIATLLDKKPLDFLASLPDGKITFAISDYSKKATKKSVISDALKLKKILTRHGRSVRIVTGETTVLSTATSLHNGLSGKNERKIELIKTENEWYRVTGVQDIDAYSRRDRERPARDAKVGMLPPKLAQILINLCGPLPAGSRILDPFCGTGVVLQEALLMGYSAYGTDISDRMVEYSEKNLEWLIASKNISSRGFGGSAENERADPVTTGVGDAPREEIFFECSVGDATNFIWDKSIDAVACEGYLGQPMSAPPADIKLKQEKQTCKDIILGFLKNLSGQIKSGTPVVIAIPAWLRPDGSYSRLEILDLLPDMGYNVNNKSREGLLYHREGQIVARDIIILRKK